MSEALWVVGGEQKKSFFEQHEWNRFRAGVVVRIDLETGNSQRVLEYESPPGHCPDERPSHIFKSATLDGETMWLCTQTEVLECSLPGFEVRRVISLPCFNDLHHVVPGPEGTLFVAVTGLDAVAEVSRDGELLRLTDVLGGNVWDRFDRRIDYRKVSTTKPHRSHPNYVFFLDGQPWVTRFEQRDAVPVDPSRNGHHRPFSIAIHGIHDGHRAQDLLFFTTVNGHLVSFDLKTGEQRDVDLNSLIDPYDDRPLGWCRGLLPTDDGRHAWIGFTRLRETRLQQNLSWIRNGFREGQRRCPTRIGLYDLERPARLWEIDLEPAGLNAVFSIHGAS
jgi:hypothetical protein